MKVEVEEHERNWAASSRIFSSSHGWSLSVSNAADPRRLFRAEEAGVASCSMSLDDIYWDL